MRAERIRGLLLAALAVGLPLCVAAGAAKPPDAGRWKSADVVPRRGTYATYADAYAAVARREVDVVWLGVGEEHWDRADAQACQSARAGSALIAPCQEFPARGMFRLGWHGYVSCEPAPAPAPSAAPPPPPPLAAQSAPPLPQVWPLQPVAGGSVAPARFQGAASWPHPTVWAAQAPQSGGCPGGVCPRLNPLP